MPYRTDIAYVYDGSFCGFLNCVYESYYKRELPELVFSSDEAQATLYEVREIESCPDNAAKVSNAVSGKISPDALKFLRDSFLTCLPGKESFMLDFVRKGFSRGRAIMDALADEPVASLYKALTHFGKEVQLYKGFVRFSEIGGVLASVIEPKNFILPAMTEHFCDRYPDEVFIIYDKTHATMLLGNRGEARLGYVDSFELGDADYEERGFRRLWQSYYDAIGIKERYNPRCRMSHMPKRYWAQMTEFWSKEELNHAQLSALKAEMKRLE